MCFLASVNFLNIFLIFNMPGYTPNIFSFIRNKNGSEALKLARTLERVTPSVTRFKDHLHFNHRLKDNNILPKSLQFNPPIKSKEGWKIVRKAGQAYLRLRISNCHTQIKKFAQRLSQTTLELRYPKQHLNSESWLIKNLSTPSSAQSNRDHNGKHNGEGSVTRRNSKTSCHVLQRTKPTSMTGGS